jgi:hypothetical protein
LQGSEKRTGAKRGAAILQTKSVSAFTDERVFMPPPFQTSEMFRASNCFFQAQRGTEKDAGTVQQLTKGRTQSNIPQRLPFDKSRKDNVETEAVSDPTCRASPIEGGDPFNTKPRECSKSLCKGPARRRVTKVPKTAPTIITEAAADAHAQPLPKPRKQHCSGNN